MSSPHNQRDQFPSLRVPTVGELRSGRQPPAAAEPDAGALTLPPLHPKGGNEAPRACACRGHAEAASRDAVAVANRV